MDDSRGRLRLSSGFWISNVGRAGADCRAAGGQASHQHGSPTTRWASVALGAGIGSAYTKCSYLFNGASPKWSPKVSTIPSAHSEKIIATTPEPAPPTDDEHQREEKNRKQREYHARKKRGEE